MAATSGVDAVARPLPGGGGGVGTVGDGFRPNLAMGGGSNRIPIDLPHGPGGVTPKLDLLYSTGLGNGIFGLGWALSAPFVERRRPSPFRPAAPDEFTLSGAEPLIDLGDGQYAPTVGTTRQVLTRVGDSWHCRTPDLLLTTFGSTRESRLVGEVDGTVQTARWLVDAITFPNGVEVAYDYETVDGELRLARLRYSAFVLEVSYAPRPDPSTSYALGFGQPSLSRVVRLLLRHNVGGGPLVDGRAWEFGYVQAPGSGGSLLSSLQIVGWHDEGGTRVESRQAPISFGYTAFDPAGQELRRLAGGSVPPPALGGEATVIDYRGTSLPGILRLGRDGATYWENRGEGRFGAPEALRQLPGGLSLAEEPVRFADLTGNGTADLLIGQTTGGEWWEHDPSAGFTVKHRIRTAAGFGLDDERTTFLDLDGDGIVDVLCFRGGIPYGFMNDGSGTAWSGPHALPWRDLPPHLDRDPRLRFADMNGDGHPDVVLLRSRQLTYWPNLGGGRLGPPVIMADTPEFGVADPDSQVLLADVDGDGVADLVLVGSGEVRVHLGQGGRGFGPAIVIGRTPPLSSSRVLLADMTGSGSPGLLWNLAPEAGGRSGYLHLDLIGGTKPYLLNRIDNGRGLSTTIEYTTSARERTRDLADGRRWSGYLPFCVHVAAAVSSADSVTGQTARVRYRYHDGQFDGRTRQWLGFAMVESLDEATEHEDATRQISWFHNGVASAGIPAFEAGRGQPHRTELVDPATGEIRQVSTATWSALPLDPSQPAAGAWLAVETERTAVRFQDGVAYAHERVGYEHDDVGNIVRESRRGSWSDDEGDHVDELTVERAYATHPEHGPTSVPVRERRLGPGGRLLKGFDWFYDGPAFVGLPPGQLTRGFLSRQTEIALTPQMRADAYGPTPPALLDELYRTEVDPVLGVLHVHDTRRYRYDGFGNQVETLDGLGHRVRIDYDAEGLSPVATAEDGGPVRALRFDPVVQQAILVTDGNGNAVRTVFDGLGEIVAVWRRSAQPDRPTETYERDRTSVPQRVVQRIRRLPDDPTPGWERHSHLDGAGRVLRASTRTATGWAIEQTKLTSIRGREIGVADCFPTTGPDFVATLPAEVARHDKHYDFAGRLVRERLFDGSEVSYTHVGLESRFFDPTATTEPSRTSRTDAWGRIVAVIEHSGAQQWTERRRYDPLGTLVGLTDATGADALVSVLDGWSSRIRIDSADAGTTTFVYDADCHEVLRTDADGREVRTERDVQGREVRIRHDGVPQEELTYDAGDGDNLVGRLARVDGPSGTVDYSYDADGNATRMRRRFPGDPTTYQVSFGYDCQGTARSVTYPDGHVVTYGFDPQGLLTSISGVVDDIEYGPHGQRTRIRFANGLETTRDYRPGDHLLREICTETVASLPGGHAVGTKLQHLVFDLDQVGRVLAAHDQSTVTGKVRNNQTFGYDDRNRLAFATGTRSGGVGFRFDYAYDAGGNLVDGEAFTGMQHGRDGADPAHPNRLVRRGAGATAEYGYDASGNLITDPELGTLDYDARHRLVAVTRPNGDRVEYAYDHHDRRITTRVTTGGVTTVRHEVEGIYVVDATASTKIIFDEDRRLALLPSSGDGLLHHLDRLGNVNVVSNLSTGAFTGSNEYTPWGVLTSSVVIEPAYAWGGALVTDGLDIVLLGKRWYRPALGRFLTADAYLLVHQDKIPGLHGAANLYLYALDNPANFSDPTGRLAFLVVLVVAAIVGAMIGAIGAAANGVKTWDEFLLWVIGGAIGGMLAAVAWGGIIVGVAALIGASVTFAAAATAGVVIFMVAGFLGAAFTPILDATDSPVAWVFSFLIKLVQSPLTTIVGLVAAAVVGIAGGSVDFRRGMLFIEVGPGGGALTLGGVAWTQSGRFNPDGTIPDDLARHEAVHSRTVAAMGELGFYFTYVTVGAIWGAAQGGDWNDLNARGCGNPFEKTAHTFTGDPATAVSASDC